MFGSRLARSFWLAIAVSSQAISEPFSVEHLVRLDRVGSPVLSPDGQRVVYAVRSTDMEANKGRYDLWWTDLLDATTRRLTSHVANDTSAAWSADGRYVYFLSSRNDSSQVWRIPMAGGEASQVTDLALDVGTFRVAASGERLVISLNVYLDCADLACTRERDEAKTKRVTTGQAYNQLFMRHWDHWLDEKRSQLFVLALNEQGVADGTPERLTRGIDADIPSRIWGGSEEYAISPDATTLYFAARLRDRDEPTSTNFDLYATPMNGDGLVRNLTSANRAWDTMPTLSPDGKTMAHLAMARPGFEADRFQIVLTDLASGRTQALAENWDRSPSAITFAPDGKALYMTAQDLGQRTLWSVDLSSGKPRKLVDGGDIGGFEISTARIVYAKSDFKTPSELYTANLDGSNARRLTHFSDAQLTNVEMGEYEPFSFSGALGETVHGFVIKPVGYRRGQRYPVAFLIHGGPQGSFSNNFHYRWNPQTYAGQGFAAVIIDFHGSTGYGQAFTDSISEDWGDKPLQDLQLGLAHALQKYDFLDGDKVCALGASYGGFMINWIAGRWPDRFSCLVNHDGVFDQRMMYYATEELWFVEWENGGPHFANPSAYEKYNPVNHVDQWKTPMLVIHGELDYRIPVTQGIAAFTALQRRGIDSRFLYFPDENHWVLKPHNSIQWHNEVNQWLHRYLD